MFDLERLVLTQAVDGRVSAAPEAGVKLHRHAESAEHHVSVAVLSPERLMSDLETRRTVHRPVDPSDLHTRQDSNAVHSQAFCRLFQD